MCDDYFDVDDEKVQEFFNDWVVRLPLNSRTMHAITMMEILHKCFWIGSSAAALEAACITIFKKKKKKKEKGKEREEKEREHQHLPLYIHILQV